MRIETRFSGLVPTVVYDTVDGTVTTWNTSGKQTGIRPLTPDELGLMVAMTGPTDAEIAALVAHSDSREPNRQTMISKAQAALAVNATYLAHAALPAGAALTTTQLTTIIRILSAEVDALAKQNNALIRLALGLLDDVSGT